MSKLLLLLSVAFTLSIFDIYGQHHHGGPSNEAGSDKQQKSKPAPLEMLSPPKGFEPATEFHGYYSTETGTSIQMVLCENIVYTTMCSAFTPEFLSANNLVLINEASFKTTSGLSGKYFKMSYTIEGLTIIRYMVFVGDLQNTLWLSISFPLMHEELVDQLLVNSLSSIKF